MPNQRHSAPAQIIDRNWVSFQPEKPTFQEELLTFCLACEAEDGRSVWTAGETMLKNKPHLVKFNHCIIVNL